MIWQRTVIFHVYFQWCLYRAVLYRIHSVYSGNHLRRCPQRYRARIPHYDADPGSALRGHHSLFRYQTGSPERCEVFPDPESREFLLDDSRSCHGTDVLLSVHCHGYPHHLRLLYEKDVSIEGSTKNVEIFDTAIAIMAGLMIIPAVFAFSGGDPDTLQAGPSLMFITLPKVFDSMGMGTFVGIMFFVLVLFAAMTSSIALTESAVSTFEDELGWGRKKSTLIMGVIMLALGTLSSLGYGPLGAVKIIGMQFLDFFDFLTNSVMMPIAAITICLLVSRVIGVKAVEEEVMHGEAAFRRKKIFNFMIKYLCPVFAAIILLSSVANAFGWIKM